MDPWTVVIADWRGVRELHWPLDVVPTVPKRDMAKLPADERLSKRDMAQLPEEERMAKRRNREPRDSSSTTPSAGRVGRSKAPIPS